MTLAENKFESCMQLKQLVWASDDPDDVYVHIIDDNACMCKSKGRRATTAPPRVLKPG